MIKSICTIALQWCKADRIRVTRRHGQLLQLSRFGFEQSASASGPLSWALSIDDVHVASGATSVGFQAISEDLALDGITGSFLLALSGDGASSNAGTYRIDNFFLEGSVSAVPLPGA